MEIEWEDGARVRWTYTAEAGAALTLDDGAGAVLSCTPRE
jgi:hypothetical protein